ncbi:helix-turn-helix domain-containing protein [Streptomyces sp. NPDC017890]|uniref:helix-turn-helix domain-containing protein n=1 Tax=Streptomyces sp. NPDC017890 TaxID=3365015 RepID=UPI0037AF252A
MSWWRDGSGARARMVELSRSGERVPAIAGELSCSPKTVRRTALRMSATNEPSPLERDSLAVAKSTPDRGR